VEPSLQGIFDPTFTGGGGPDYTLLPEDFPFHVLQDAEENNFNNRVVLFDTNDVTSSMGVFAEDFWKVVLHKSNDVGIPFVDPVFNLDNPFAKRINKNVRRVAPRNTPTMINAVFNHSNFLDGRAHNLFNGATVIGPLDPNAVIYVSNWWGKTTPTKVSIPNSSLASQAVGPPTSNLEMSFFDRPFPDIGRKLLSLRPLGLQKVDPRDSVLGRFSRASLVKYWNRRGKHFTQEDMNGLFVYYPALIMKAFQPKYWASHQKIYGYTQMEMNFSLFFGLAVQLYESTLVSDRAPFDRFMEGDDNALSQEQLQGLLVFLNQGARGNPPEVDAAIAASGLAIGAGNCISCHGGPEFTDAAFSSLTDEDELELIEVEDTTILDGGLLAVSPVQGLLDNGFSNIGVRPTDNDLGRGGEEGGFPLSFTRQMLDPALNFLLEGVVEDFPCTPGVDCPDQLLVDGAFKIPGLRNVELTGPYFHNGGQATLSQVVEFYDRQSDFADVNIDKIDRNLVFIALEDVDEEPLVEFLLSLTDTRVQNEKAPFDHPQLFVPNGGTFGKEQPRIEIPAVGAAGRPAKGLPPLGTFLDLEHVD
jgi:cytochrome c peroxidase